LLKYPDKRDASHHFVMREPVVGPALEKLDAPSRWFAGRCSAPASLFNQQTKLE
jgi:hypothetical protein